MKGYKGSMGSMGWPGKNDDSFPIWAIDIIQFRNKKFQEESLGIISERGCSPEIASLSIEKKYENMDLALNEMIKFVEYGNKSSIS